MFNVIGKITVAYFAVKAVYVICKTSRELREQAAAAKIAESCSKL